MSQSLQASDIILINDPKILAVKIIDNYEAMIDLKTQHAIAYGPSPEILGNTDYTRLRKTVYEKLKLAQISLPENLHFCMYEGYRSIELQTQIFNDRYSKVKKLHPDWTEERIFLDTTKYVSPVINQDKTQNIPPHSTGGAVDIYLLDGKGDPVEMGILPKDWMEDNDGLVSMTASDVISAKARKYRDIMSKVLTDAGFVNYPTEYWHWSYGDRYWAYHKKQPHAVYGSFKD